MRPKHVEIANTFAAHHVLEIVQTALQSGFLRIHVLTHGRVPVEGCCSLEV
jgi:hypothetical protein